MSKMKLAFTPIAQLQAVTENEIWKIKVRVARMWRFQNGDKTGDVGGVDLILVDDKVHIIILSCLCLYDFDNCSIMY